MQLLVLSVLCLGLASEQQTEQYHLRITRVILLAIYAQIAHIMSWWP